MAKFEGENSRSVLDRLRSIKIEEKIAGVLVCGLPRRRNFKVSRKNPKNSAVSPPLERLWKLLEVEMSDLELDEAEMKNEQLAVLQSAVRILQAYDSEECERNRSRKEAAMELRRLARNDASARETLAMLGAIPPLIEMLDSDQADMQVASLYAILNLGIGNNANKSAIVAAGAVEKMNKLIDRGSIARSVSDAVIANFLNLSALDENKEIIGSSRAIAFLVEAFRAVDFGDQARLDTIRAILNLAMSPDNVPRLIASGLVPDLMAAIGDMQVSEKVLSVLSFIVSTAEGRTAISQTSESFLILIDVLNWSDSPRCQEEASFVLLAMAQRSFLHRRMMIETGIVSSLLELALIGSPLAQYRAAGILEWLKLAGEEIAFDGESEDRPRARVTEAMAGEGREMCDDRRAVSQLVQQSLLLTTTRVLRRANLLPT
ncbi:U-box domain-containing protein 45-like isoform X2 [Wolffia australiana]